MGNLINTIISLVLGWLGAKRKVKAKTREIVDEINQSGNEARSNDKKDPDPRFCRD